ncbi:protein of unknown function [Pseudomonas sp. JV551A1]|uniref:Uncharacterized protein n=1 Tax=Pseudomonas inefficax TaxID=2078786 RepID=A0AAQ1SW90_9PSED|nr:protein of unknown function [Pseudomonas sp. JV551A1]SPO63905.1 protein of unknown function [Pseudomonas inefficax]
MSGTAISAPFRAEMLESDGYFADDMALAVPAWPCARLNLHVSLRLACWRPPGWDDEISAPSICAVDDWPAGPWRVHHAPAGCPVPARQW